MIRLRDEARAAGLLVRFEYHGILAIAHPRHATEEEKKKLELLAQPQLAVSPISVGG